MQQQGNHEYPFLYQRQTCYQVQPNQATFFFFSSRRRHTRFDCDWSSDVCCSDLGYVALTDYREGRPAGWGAYLAGVMHELVALGAAPLEGGARIAVTSNVPVAAGLASSAALTVAAAQALSLLGGTRLQARQLAGVAFRAEHDHVGVRCGIMDQMSAALARPGRALLLECASLAARHIPIRGHLLLVDSGLRRELAAGALNERRAECEAAVARLTLELPELRWLASWPAAWLPRLKRALPEPLRSRA